MKKVLLTLVLILALITCLASCEWLFPSTPDVPDHEHAFDRQVATDEYKASDATCLQPASYYYSCTCGKKGTDTFTDGAALGHSFSDELSYDDNGHWYAATCEHKSEKKDMAEHSLTLSEDGLTKNCSCGYSKVAALATPANLAYENGTFSFDAVSGADTYLINILDGEDVVATKEISTTSLVLSTLGKLGEYTVQVIAKSDDISSAAASLECTVVYLDSGVIFEAEDYVTNPGHVWEDSLAHGGALAIDFNDCGQGFGFYYYSYEAGTRAVDVHYAMGEQSAEGALMVLFANGKPAYIEMTELTGWFDEGKRTAVATVEVELVEGWNYLNLIKFGDASNNYGRWAQIDYVEVHGTGKTFDIDAFPQGPDMYKFEAEHAEWHWANASTRPANWSGEGFSGWYGLGTVDNPGDGVKFTLDLPAGEYDIILAYGSDKALNVNVAVNGGDATAVAISGSTAWSDVQLVKIAADVVADGGAPLTIDITRADHWLTIDYIIVVPKSHIHNYDRQNPITANKASDFVECESHETYYYSCACGEKGTETFVTRETTIGHSFSDTHSYDSTNHWYAATCSHSDEKKDLAAHTLAPNAEKTHMVCSCGYSTPVATSLDVPANLAFANGTLTFDAVDGAAFYKVTVLSGETVVYTKEISETSISLRNLGFYGNHTISVVALGKNAALDDIQSAAATTEQLIKYYDDGALVEAEDSVLNPKHIWSGEDAHGGGLALDFNDCGQGVYFRYFAYEAGERTLTIHYATGSAGSQMQLFVNGADCGAVVFDTNTGWNNPTGVKTVTVTVKEGWNELSLIKHGNADNNWGGWVQLDYFVFSGTEKEYDISNIDFKAEMYKLEAEIAAWHWANGNTRPSNWGGDGFSGWYGLGSIDNPGDGVKYTLKVADAGTYKVVLAYGNGGTTDIKVSVNGADATTATLPASGGWSSVALAEIASGIELNAGDTLTVDVLRGDVWFTIDYILIVSDSHSCEFTNEVIRPAYLATSYKECEQSETYYKSCVCGAKGTETFVTRAATDGHTFSEQITYDSENHWYPATCSHSDEKKELAPHSLTVNSDGTRQECSCGYYLTIVTSLDKPTGLAVADGALTWDAMENASFLVTITRGTEQLYSQVINTNSVDLTGFSAGELNISVTAKGSNILGNEISSDEATLSVAYYDGSARLEAEGAIFAINKENNEFASGGAYVKDFNDNDTVTFRYYSYVAGERAITVGCTTGFEGAYVMMYVNGGEGIKVLAPVNGWYGTLESSFVTVTATVKEGWNEIVIKKTGADSSWIQLDYIQLAGSMDAYDAVEAYYVDTTTALGSAAVDAGWSNFTGKAGVGTINNVGDGARFTFTIAQAGTYQVKLAYGGGDRTVMVKVNDNEAVAANISGSTAWDNVVLCDLITITAEAGQTFTLDVTRGEGGDWFTVDYLIIEKTN